MPHPPDYTMTKLAFLINYVDMHNNFHETCNRYFPLLIRKISSNESQWLISFLHAIETKIESL